jgi:hypothetical protein
LSRNWAAYAPFSFFASPLLGQCRPPYGPQLPHALPSRGSKFFRCPASRAASPSQFVGSCLSWRLPLEGRPHGDAPQGEMASEPARMHPHGEPAGQVAQLVEQWTENPCVAGSIPALTTFRHPHRPASISLSGPLPPIRRPSWPFSLGHKIGPFCYAGFSSNASSKSLRNFVLRLPPFPPPYPDFALSSTCKECRSRYIAQVLAGTNMAFVC